jgi:hypothetical protein
MRLTNGLACIIALGEKVAWWHFAITWEPYFLTLMWIDFVLSAFTGDADADPKRGWAILLSISKWSCVLQRK